MTSTELVEAALRATGYTKSDLAEKLGCSRQNLSYKLIKSSMRADDMLNIFDILGIDVTLTLRETGKIVKPRICGAGRRVRSMVNRITYDTEFSDALSNSFYADGVNKYTDDKASELYIDLEGRYFLAEYTTRIGFEDKIRPVDEEYAKAYIAKYGTEIHKEPMRKSDEDTDK